MRSCNVTTKFCLKLAIAALAIVAGCATAQSPAVDPATRPAVTTVYLVRHAEKSTLAPTDPDITVAGKERAAALATRLRTAGVDAIIVTQFKRTLETAKPLASTIGVVPEIVPAGGSHHADSVAAAVMRHRGGKILIVGHSNTLAPIIAALGGPRLPDLCDSEYSNLYVLYIPASGHAELTRHHYGAADRAPDSACEAMQTH